MKIMWQGASHWRRLHTLQHSDTVFAVHAVGNRVITGSNDHTAGVWDLHTGVRLHTLQHNRAVIAVHAMGNRVITGSFDDTAGIWDLHISPSAARRATRRSWRARTLPAA